MATEEVVVFFEELGLEEVDLNDEPSLFQDLDDGNYAIVTDMDGIAPVTLTEPLYWTLYNADDEFCWSVTLENATAFRESVRAADGDAKVLVKKLAELRAKNIAEFEAKA